MSSPEYAEKTACLRVLAAITQLDGEPTPEEFESFMAVLATFQPLPPGLTPEGLLATPKALEPLLAQIHTPERQQQVYRGACDILRRQGIKPHEAKALSQLAAAFEFTPELAQSLAKQPLVTPNSHSAMLNSALAGINSLVRREGEVRRLIFDYALGAAIVGLIPITGGGSLEVKLLVVLGLILKMIWDIRALWGKPRGQDVLAVIGNIFGFLGAVVGGFLAWATMIGLGVIIPFVGAFAKAAGFATATWIVGQSTNQFYTSQKRPDLTALKRAFPNLLPSDR